MKKAADIGIDLHTDNFYACYLYKDGTEKYEKFSLNEEGFVSFFQTISKKDRLAVEATGNTSFFVNKVKPHVRKVIVVSTGHFFVISKSSKKTDKNDAKSLAFYLQKNLLPVARIKSQKSQLLASLIKTRLRFVKVKSILIIRIHSILVRHGIKVGKNLIGTKSGFSKYVSCHAWDGPTRIEIEILGQQLAETILCIKRFDKEIELFAKGFHGYENLLSISGVGPFSAAVFLSVIDNIHDFSTPNKLASYFGIVPKSRESNGNKKGSKITKRGSKIGRSILIQCCWVAIRYSEYLKNFYERIAKGGSGKKAIVACARKLLIIIYNTLKNDWIFDDFAAFQFHTKGKNLPILI